MSTDAKIKFGIVAVLAVLVFAAIIGGPFYYVALVSLPVVIGGAILYGLRGPRRG